MNTLETVPLRTTARDWSMSLLYQNVIEQANAGVRSEPVRKALAPQVSDTDRQALSAAALEFMQDAVMALNSEGVVTTANPAFQAMFGLAPADIVGRTFAETMIERPELEEFNDTIVDAIHQPDNTIARDIEVRRDGIRRYLSVRTNLLTMPGKRGYHGLIAVVSDETSRVQALRTQTEYARLMLAIVASLAVSLLATSAMFKNLKVSELAGGVSLEWVLVSWGYLLVSAIPSLIYIWISGLPLSTVGLTTKNWRRSVGESLLASLAIGLLLLGIASYLRTSSGSAPDDPLFKWNFILSLGGISYALHSVLQEFVARGVMLSSVRRLLPNKSNFLSILLVAIVFSAFHAAWGYSIVVFTFLSSFIFGWMYLRQGNLIGVSILHFIVGSLLFAINF